MPTVEELKHGVRCMMAALWLVSESYKYASDMPARARSLANVLIVGIIFCNGFAGSSGDWQRMTSAHVRECVRGRVKWLTCPKHNKMAHYGDLAKWLADGTWDAVEVYLGLPGKRGSLFLDPVLPGTEHERVSRCMRALGAMFWPECESPTCTLLRKWYHTFLLRMPRTGKLMKLLNRVDKHSEGVQCGLSQAQRFVMISGQPELVGEIALGHLDHDTVRSMKIDLILQNLLERFSCLVMVATQ